MTFNEFKAHVTVFSWRPNDTVLAASLNNIIKMANAYLNTRLELSRRKKVFAASLTTQDYALKTNIADYRTFNYLATDQEGKYPYRSVPVVSLRQQRTNNQSALSSRMYALEDDTLLLADPVSATNPLDVFIGYNSNVPDYETSDASWVADEFLDLYTYAVLMHVAIFLRDTQRIAEYKQLADDAVGAAVDEDKHKRNYGSPMAEQGRSIYGPSNSR